MRRLSTVFWTASLGIFILILYLECGISLELPKIKHTLEDKDKSKWSAIESKLHPIESELNKHYEKFSDIKFAFHQKKYLLRKRSTNFSNKVQKLSKIPFNLSSCPIQMQIVPKTDIQMLSLYNRIAFDNNSVKDWKTEYKENQWNKTNKLKVFIVPFSHNDPGWIYTFERYYDTRTHMIFSNIVDLLPEGKARKFLWSEISFLAMWWDTDANNDEKMLFQNLLKEKRIEIVTGGWVMNDEANTHWLSTVQQLTAGHQWCIEKLGIAPKNSWSIDPFGYSSTQPYLLKLAGFDNSVIQRVHYRVKKEFASNKQLEFRWRQLWDGVGETDMFTHLFPFVSYNVMYSCGPDPKICCQFDFGSHSVSCLPQKITENNVRERASLILDQWRKKAQLYRSNIVLFPLGDDFRYGDYLEWDKQFQNYDMLIEYINNKEELNAEVQFGNLDDYFKALHSEMNLSDFPVLSGDFFTYADEPLQYWSGYFTSRPFYKNMDRVLLAHVRAAETISSQVMSSYCLSNMMSLQLRDRVEKARRSLALFQHHDAISGTSRAKVVKDYAKKMRSAIENCESVIQQAAYYLLAKPSNIEETHNIYFDDVWRRYNEIPSRITITFDYLSPSRKIVLYNSLPFTRREVLTVFISSPHVEVFDPAGKPVMTQISPAVVGNQRLTFADYKYQLSFPVVVNTLALTTYTVALRSSNSINKYVSYSRVRVYNHNTVKLPKLFRVKQSSAKLMEDINIQIRNSTQVVASVNGLIKTIVSPDGTVVPVNMDFVIYDSQRGDGKNSGAYLFMPSGPAQPFDPEPFPQIFVIEGIYESTIYTALASPELAEVTVAISLINNPSLQQSEVKVVNTLFIDPEVQNLEFAMRFSTNINNKNVFYTDVNGMQMTKRRYFDKLPLQANYYPLPAAAYIEDDYLRFTLLTSTPLGVAALQPGQIEVMQDRRTSIDDSRGLGQAVRDNVRTRHTFKLIIENANNPCPLKIPAEHPSGQLTLGAHVSQQLMLQPLVTMHYTEQDVPLSSGYSRITLNAADLVLAAYRTDVITKSKDGARIHGMGMTFQRVYLEPCYGNKDISKWYPLSDGQFQIRQLVDVPSYSVHESTLTFVSLKNQLPNGVITLCPQEVRSVFINDTFNSC
ncbi:unnamed protein product [Arctia plantaginis]|uniref:Alpha-mannosidase n=1 Tax=Arctia plantaginis TaxID=874455 RepID=A0A8S1AM06_ARCPL|nr:unnamed protein product [Arctia plantaginis]